MLNITDGQDARRLLGALGEQLERIGASYDLVVAGGSALLALGLISRPTKDVDVVALRTEQVLQPATDFPEPLETSRARVARDYGLPEDWLNGGPTSLLDHGLPEGFLDRAVRREFGPCLTVWYASRLDQIHFKLYAAVDQGPGKHEADLRQLEPTEAELLAAAQWSMAHDPSPGFRHVFEQALAAFGVRDANLGP